MDKIRNQIRETEQVECFENKLKEVTLRWFGHVQRRDEDYIGRKILRIELQGRRRRRRTKSDIGSGRKRRMLRTGKAEIRIRNYF